MNYVHAMDNEVKQRNRRRKRAQRMQAQRHEKAKDGDSGEDESPVREKPQRPPNRRKKSKEPLVEEDIVDGFAILGFKTYEDLEVSVSSVSLFGRGTRCLTRLSQLVHSLPGDRARTLRSRTHSSFLQIYLFRKSQLI